MHAIALQSGSNGNCIFVESGDVRLLFDAGISGVQAEKRLAGHGIDIRDVDALIISHDHSDHSRCAGIFGRKYKIPLYITPQTFEASNRRGALGSIPSQIPFASGQPLRFGSVTVETIPTPHDAADGVAFIVDDGHARLGILTDLGHDFEPLRKIVESIDAAFIESNYDPEMLRTGPYPWFLKNRIMGPSGHLSNHECAELIQASGKNLSWVCLSHLSEQNNTPEHALKAHENIITRDIDIHVASRYRATAVFNL